MAVLGSLLTQLLHLGLMLFAAPLLVGVVRWLKSRLMGRRGPHPMQPWRDLLKLLQKRPVLAESASIVSRVAPYLALGATLLAAALVPSFAFGMILAPVADLLLIGGLLALSRVALALNGHDAGTPFGGLGAGRELTFAVFAEPALLVCVMVFAVLIGTTNLNAIGHGLSDGQIGVRVSLLFAAVALVAVALAENARVPVDNPATHLELTMVHEAMLLEASGRHLALWEMQAALKMLVWLGLLATLFLPFGTAAPGSGPFSWAMGLLAWAVKIGLLALALAVFESAIAKMRVFRVPEFLGGALMLALLAAALIFVSTGLA
jgi:formate hydrogenlyase subunit 4